MNLYSGLYDSFHPLDIFFPKAGQVVAREPSDLQGPGILIIHGGADISPSLYNKGRSRRTYADEVPSYRDKAEWALIQEAIKQKIFIFGICRGAQMLCAAAGGYLIQDVTNHAGSGHMVYTDKGEFKVNSLHHQMQAPWDVEHQILAVSEPLSEHFLDVDNDIKVPNEPEAVYYPTLNGLGVQWHPEMMYENTYANLWIKETLKEYVHE